MADVNPHRHLTWHAEPVNLSRPDSKAMRRSEPEASPEPAQAKCVTSLDQVGIVHYLDWESLSVASPILMSTGGRSVPVVFAWVALTVTSAFPLPPSSLVSPAFRNSAHGGRPPATFQSH